MKKCQPLKCKTFTAKAYKFEDKVPVDAIVVKCPFRRQDHFCENEKEALTEAYY